MIKKMSFDSMSAYGDSVKQLDDNKTYGVGCRKKKASRSNASTQDWDFNTGFMKALDITCNGGAWHEGAEELSKIDNVLEASKEMAIKPYYDLAPVGGCVDVGEFLAGNPECFMGIDDNTPNSPIIKITVSLFTACIMKAHHLYNFGRALLSLIEGLEFSGYSVELVGIAAMYNDYGNDGLETHITLKKAGDQWSAGNIAYAIAHPAFSRRVGFRAIEAYDETAFLTKESYGSGQKLKKPDNSDIHFPYIVTPSVLESQTGAIEYVKEIAKSFLSVA